MSGTVDSIIERVLESYGRSFERVPGLLRRWEIAQVLSPGAELHVEEAGEDADGTVLYAVYRRSPRTRVSSVSTGRGQR